MSREAMEMALDAITDWGVSRRKVAETVEALRAALAQPEPEPVAYLNVDEDGDVKSMEWGPDMLPGVHALYAAPPRREWVGLTDDEVMSLLPGAVRLPPGWADTVRAIEAKLKEKNT